MNLTPERRQCPYCHRPQRTCLCQWITPTANLVEVVILRHPLETKQAKNTAQLLHLSLQHSQLIDGEQFADDFLTDVFSRDYKTSILLYPPTPDENALGLVAPPALPDHLLPEQTRLIVIDGTWRKSRKMLYLNTCLHNLPRLSLSNCPASHYAIRKAQQDNQLSTLEASCYALQQLENARVDYAPLLASFKGFVRQQLAFMPPRT